MKPVYALRLQRENDRYLRTWNAAHAIGWSPAAWRGFLKEVATGQVTVGIKRLSINEMAQLVLDDVQYIASLKCRDAHLAPELAGDPFSLGTSALAPSR